MPRTGATYFLPSPPSPYQPNTLAAAEDVNTSLNDIAVALTNSLPMDGSGAMTGPLNMAGQNINGVASLNTSGPLTVPNLSATGTINSPQYYGANMDLTGTILTNSGRIISTNTSSSGDNNPSFTCLDVNQNYAAGMFLGINDALCFGDMDGGGNALRTFAFFDPAGDLTVGGNVVAVNFDTGGEVSAAYLQSTGNASISGELNVGAINTTVGGINLASDIYLNSHWIRDVANILGPGGGTVTIGSPLFVAGPVQASAGIQTTQIATTNGGGMSWWFGENGGYGIATSSSGSVYIWQAFERAVVDQLPRSLTRDVGGGLRAVDTNACLVAIFDELRTLSDRLEALEALVPA